MTSKIVVNNIESDTGIATITISSPVSLSGGTTGGVTVGTGASIASPSSNVLTISTNNSERIRVGAAGSIGIGTDNPTKQITVGAAITTGLFQVSPHTAGWDIGVTSGNLAPHYQTDFSLYTGQIGAGTKRFGVDSSGRVTMPYQPAFAAYDSSGTTRTSGIVIWNVELFDRQNNYDASNGIFTAPVNGVYLFRTDFRAANTSGNPIIDIVTSNGYRTRHEETAGIVNQYHQSLCMVCYMSANDFAYVEVASGSIRMDNNQIDNFAGFLVG